MLRGNRPVTLLVSRADQAQAITQGRDCLLDVRRRNRSKTQCKFGIVPPKTDLSVRTHTSVRRTDIITLALES